MQLRLGMMSTRRTFAVLLAALTCCSTGARRIDRHIAAASKLSEPPSLQPEQQAVRNPAQQPQQLKDVAWQSTFVAALNSQVESHVNKGDSVSSSQHAGSGGGEGGSKQKMGPVAVQVSEEEIKKLMLQFSDGCKHRMNAQLEGKGTALHTFGGPTGNASEANCDALNGTICDTHALVMQKRSMPNNRELLQTTDVAGKGCLPSECMSSPDLEALSRFMHGQARNQVPGMGVTVELRVDCTHAGGNSAMISDKSGKPVGKGLGRNSATSRWPQWSTLAAMLSGFLLHP